MGVWPKSLMAGVFAAAALSLLAAPAYAQKDDKDSNTVIDPDSLPEAKALDRRYREILNRQPDTQGSNDPWAKVRGSDVTNKDATKKDKKQPAPGTTATK